MDTPSHLEQGAGINRSDNALQELSDNLAKDIFARASTSESGDKFETKDSTTVGRVHGSALDEKFVGTADIEVTRKALPQPIEIGSGQTTVVPSMEQSAFSALVVKPLLEHAYQSTSGKSEPVDIKLALKDGKELTGKMTISFADLYSN